MEFLQKNKNVVVVVGILLVLLVGGFVLTRGGADSSANKDTESTLPDVEVLPTVDPSVIVKLEADAKGQNVTLMVENFPATTRSIEYELSYDALVEGETVPKGVIGDIDVKGTKPVLKEITLGTCSSGTCKYDDGIKSIHVTLKFVGGYGAQLFTGDFKL